MDTSRGSACSYLPPEHDPDYTLELEVGDMEPMETGYRKWSAAWRDA
jgi:hypothetical protein